jgi:hypothetical protein
MKVWVIECDHEPMVGQKQRVPTFRDDRAGAVDMKRFLNSLATDQESHYYDAVLYERIEPKTLQILESGS